jgi:hypothetical protein
MLREVIAQGALDGRLPGTTWYGWINPAMQILRSMDRCTFVVLSAHEFWRWLACSVFVSNNHHLDFLVFSHQTRNGS